MFGHSEMGAADAAAAKRVVRDEVRDRRRARNEDQRRLAGLGIAERGRELILARGARSLSCYLPLPEEPPTRALLDWAEACDLEVLLPCVRADGLLDWAVASRAGTVRGAFGIDEPSGERLAPHTVERVDLMLVPAAAADLRGGRLGWGRGYFDRVLAQLGRRPPVIAVLFDDEVVERLPLEPHDVPIDGVITPERLLLHSPATGSLGSG